MPLVQSASPKAVSANIRREQDAGKPHRQAIAIALDIQRRNRRAGGGGIIGSAVHGLMKPITHPGLVHSTVAGRTDHIPAHVPSGSYVIPADHVSHLGQGNSLAGGKVLDRIFKTHSTIPKPPAPMKRADGGEVSEPVPIIIAGGEYVLHPDQVREIGHGDLNSGHEALDKWITSTRKAHIQTLKSLPPPKT